MAKEWKAAGKLKCRKAWVAECQGRKNSVEYLRKTNFDNVPMKPQRVYQCMNRTLDRDTTYVSTIGLSQIAGAQFLHVYKPRNWINCGQAGPLGWTTPAALGVRVADPKRKIVALSGDYDFQFMIEELAVGAQFKLPYVHVLVNNSYLGLIRQAQRAFSIDYCVQWRSTISTWMRVKRPVATVLTMLRLLKVWVARPSAFTAPKTCPCHGAGRSLDGRAQDTCGDRVHPGRVTNISMGAEIDNVVEFEDLATEKADAPSALALLD